MKTFEFNKDVIDGVVQELAQAEKYIRIAIFQLHNQQVFQVLNERLRDGVRVEVFTLPYDSVNDDVRDEVTSLFRNLEGNGGILYFCRWNVGDPRTQTAVGRWYSFHGKFIVTEKSAIALSANLTETPELDAILVFRNEPGRIAEFNEKFDRLVSLFISDDSGHDGEIYRRIVNTKLRNVSTVFELPSRIETDVHKSHWIKHYPSSLCPTQKTVTDRLYLMPFDARGRDFLMSVISEASEFAYISTESFTDTDFADFLTKVRLSGLDIRVLSGVRTMDFTDRVQDMFRSLLAQGILTRKPKEALHAKLIVTDKHVVISSMNLNNIDLGFEQTKAYWRENTETVCVSSDPVIISEAKNQFLDAFSGSTDIKVILAEKVEKVVGRMLSNMFSLRSRQDAKQVLALLILQEEIEAKKVMLRVGRIISKLMRLSRRSMVDKEDVFMALLLHYLAERKQDITELRDKVRLLDPKMDTRALLSQLIHRRLIEKEGGYYKVNIESLFGRV